jgi:hypothetical protein
LSGRGWLSFGADLHATLTTSAVWVDSTTAYGEVGVVCSACRDGDDASRGGVMTMTLACCLADALFGAVCVGFLLCAAQRL